jgi:hypothetical protein
MSFGMKSIRRACCSTEADVVVMATQIHWLSRASSTDPMDDGR